MIRIEAIQLQRLAAETLRQLGVADMVQATDVGELTDGTWLVRFEDRWPTTRFPIFEIYIEQEWSPEQAGRELRIELRKKLWICPLCQRRATIRRVVDQEAFRVDCDHCGRFEIDAALLDQLRLSLENADAALVQRLPHVSDYVRGANRIPFLSPENWRELAGE